MAISQQKRMECLCRGKDESPQEPEQMKELTNDVLMQLIHEVMDEVIAEAKKPKKKDCEPRNKFHDSDGRFSSRENVKSWSGSNPSGKPNCKHGQSKASPAGKGVARRFTKMPCGRAKPKDDPNSKAKYKCKDGELAEQDEKEHCKDYPTIERMKCEQADEDSRNQSQRRRQKQRELHPGYEELRKLSKGITESSSNSLRAKVIQFIKTLSSQERAVFTKAIRGDSLKQKLTFCSAVSDAAAGKMDDNKRKAAEIKARHKLKQRAQRAKERAK
jgi:hypothetical protein